jgi:hypothetical protein
MGSLGKTMETRLRINVIMMKGGLIKTTSRAVHATRMIRILTRRLDGKLENRGRRVPVQLASISGILRELTSAD